MLIVLNVQVCLQEIILKCLRKISIFQILDLIFQDNCIFHLFIIIKFNIF